jgi:hypothetical protein
MKKYILQTADGSERINGYFDDPRNAAAWAMSILATCGTGDIVVGDWETRSPDSERKLFWRDEASADNDSGANAIAQLIAS